MSLLNLFWLTWQQTGNVMPPVLMTSLQAPSQSPPNKKGKEKKRPSSLPPPFSLGHIDLEYKSQLQCGNLPVKKVVKVTWSSVLHRERGRKTNSFTSLILNYHAHELPSVVCSQVSHLHFLWYKPQTHAEGILRQEMAHLKIFNIVSICNWNIGCFFFSLSQ